MYWWLAEVAPLLPLDAADDAAEGVAETWFSIAAAHFLTAVPGMPHQRN